MKTARFAQLVSAAGQPEVHQLWVPAARDPEFQRALKAHRVLTVHQENVWVAASVVRNTRGSSAGVSA